MFEELRDVPQTRREKTNGIDMVAPTGFEPVFQADVPAVSANARRLATPESTTDGPGSHRIASGATGRRRRLDS